jgi:chromosome segregation ATPase
MKNLLKNKRLILILSAALLTPLVGATSFYVGEQLILTNTINKQNQTILELQTSNLELSTQKDSVNNLIVSRNNIISSLTNQIVAVKSAYDNLIIEKDQISEELKSLERITEELANNVKELNRQLLISIQSGSINDVKTLNELNLDYDALIAQTNQQISFYTQEIASLTSLNSTLTTTINSLSTLIDEIEARIFNKLEIINDNDDSITILNQEVGELSEELLIKLEDFVIDQDSDVANEYRDKLLTIADLSIEKNSLEFEIDELLEEKDLLLIEYDTLVDISELIKANIDLLNEEVAGQEELIDQLNAQIGQVELDILNLELFVQNNAYNVSLNDINYISQVSIKANVMVRLTLTLDDNYGGGVVFKVEPGTTNENRYFYILTNFETIENYVNEVYDNIYIFNYYFNGYQANLIRHDNNFGLLRVLAPLNTFLSIPLAELDYEYNVSQLVFSMSSQAQQVNALRVGRVSQLNLENQTLTSFDHNAFLIGQLLRGGALINEDYQLIGFNFSGSSSSAYPINLISAFLDEGLS